MSKQPKIENTQRHDDHTVVPAKLILIEKDDLYNFPHGDVSLCEHGDVETSNRSPLSKKLLPVLVSETEEIEEGDWMVPKTNDEVLRVVEIDRENNYAKCDNGDDVPIEGFNKVLAFPEQFSHEHLQAIEDGKMKDGDGVLVGCDKSAKKRKTYLARTYYVHLDEQGHVKIFYDERLTSRDMEEAAKDWAYENLGIISKKGLRNTKDAFKAGVRWLKERQEDLIDVDWLTLGTTDEYDGLKEDIAHVCRDVTEAGCIDEICINDIIQTFDNHGYKVVKKED